MPYEEEVAQLIAKIRGCSVVQDFQKAETALRAEQGLFDAQEEMKRLQKAAVLYQKIGKMQAYKVTSQAAQEIEKSLKDNLLVENYLLQLKDVNDLLQYVTKGLEESVRLALERTEKR